MVPGLIQVKGLAYRRQCCSTTLRPNLQKGAGASKMRPGYDVIENRLHVVKRFRFCLVTVPDMQLFTSELMIKTQTSASSDIDLGSHLYVV
jgi:hypothetical protein